MRAVFIISTFPFPLVDGRKEADVDTFTKISHVKKEEKIQMTFFVEDSRSINVSNDFTVNILKAGLESCILIVIIHN